MLEHNDKNNIFLQFELYWPAVIHAQKHIVKH